MLTVINDNWTRLRYKKNYLYHITTIDRLESIKKFGLNPVIANAKRRSINYGGIYFSSTVASAIEALAELTDSGLKEKLVLFAVSVNNPPLVEAGLEKAIIV